MLAFWAWAYSGESRWTDEHVDLMSCPDLKNSLAGPGCGWDLGGHVHDEGVGADVADLVAVE